MNIKTKFSTGDNLMLGKLQVVVCRIRINVGVTIPRFNKNEARIEYQISEGKNFYGWVDEGLLLKSKLVKK